MKVSKSIAACRSICLLVLVCCFQSTFAQTSFTGSWEGVFMGEFKAYVDFRMTGTDVYSGSIRMLSGENVIQDDELTEISLVTNQLKFYIPNKNTSFEGQFNLEMTELAGDFIFPDGTRHAIHLKKTDEEDSAGEYLEIKTRRFGKDQLIADLDFLYKSLQEHHPRLYAYTPKDSFDIYINTLKESVDTSMTLDEFYFLASMLTEKVRCSHTGVRPAGDYRDLAKESGHYFPLRLFFENGEAYYVSGASGTGEIVPGTEIVSINALPVRSVLERMSSLIPREGFNESTVYYELNHKFNELFYYLDDSEEFEVRLRDSDSTKSVVVQAVGKEELDVNDLQTEENKEISFYYFDDEETGVLQILTFGMENMQGYFDELDRIFQGLKTRNIERLVLDLRGNHGGHPIYAAQLLSYLVEQEFVYFKRNEDVVDFEPLYNLMQANELKYDGHLYVFIDGGCLSTTGHFISLLKYLTDAVFVGEEPGSSFRCNDFSVQQKLPNSGIEVNIPRTTFETAVGGAAKSNTFPLDYHVNYKFSDIIQNKDPYFDVLTAVWNR